MLGAQVSLTVFKRLLPWYIKFIQRETCCCKHCENFRLYLDALNKTADLLAVLLPDARADDADGDEDGERESESPSQPETPIAKLVRVFRLKSKQMFANEFVCGGSLSDAKPDCYNCKCGSCGLKKLWSDGLGCQLVAADGTPKPGIDPVWLTHVKWWCIKSHKSGGNTADGQIETQDSKDLLRERREVTRMPTQCPHGRVYLLRVRPPPHPFRVHHTHFLWCLPCRAQLLTCLMSSRQK